MVHECSRPCAYEVATKTNTLQPRPNKRPWPAYTAARLMGAKEWMRAVETKWRHALCARNPFVTDTVPRTTNGKATNGVPSCPMTRQGFAGSVVRPVDGSTTISCTSSSRSLLCLSFGCTVGVNSWLRLHGPRMNPSISILTLDTVHACTEP